MVHHDFPSKTCEIGACLPPFSDMFRERYENAALKIDREADFTEIVFGNLFKFAMVYMAHLV